MLHYPGHRIGDSWFYASGSDVHCFFLTCTDDIPLHTRWSIGHAVSSDLVNWDILGTVLQPGSPGSWDGVCPATGSVLRWDGRYWMAYTGNWMGPDSTVGMAVSDDLHSWRKIDQNPVTRINPRWYEPVGSGINKRPHWRDPDLFVHDGAVYHYVCASRVRAGGGSVGALGLARTYDMRSWEVLPPPEIDCPVEELECPQLLSVDGCYYVLFSTNGRYFSPEFIRRYPEVQRHNAAFALVGSSPFGPFQIHECGNVLPFDGRVQPYACRIVYLRDTPYMLGTVWGDGPDYICDPIPVRFSATGVEAG